MDNFEKVEKLRQKANVSYEEAKQALENCDWDLLDAMVYLEQSGRVHGSGQASYTTQPGGQTIEVETEKKEEKKVSFGELVKRFCSWCVGWINKGNNNSFCVEREGREIFRMPITVLILLVIFTSGTLVILLIIVGLFFNMRYQFAGPDIGAVDLNKAMDAVADAAEDIKETFHKDVD